jgi:hypothetical protein
MAALPAPVAVVLMVPPLRLPIRNAGFTVSSCVPGVGVGVGVEVE